MVNGEKAVPFQSSVESCKVRMFWTETFDLYRYDVRGKKSETAKSSNFFFRKAYDPINVM